MGPKRVNWATRTALQLEGVLRRKGHEVSSDLVAELGAIVAAVDVEAEQRGFQAAAEISDKFAERARAQGRLLEAVIAQTIAGLVREEGEAAEKS